MDRPRNAEITTIDNGVRWRSIRDFSSEASSFRHHFAMAQKAKKAEFDASAVGVFSYPGSHHVNSDYGLGSNAIGASGPASRRDTSRT